jgi:uncharacterized membrane-anchored protein
MRTLGSILIILGALALAAALLSLFGPQFRSHGVITSVVVTSVRGAFIGGVACIVIGAVLRRRAAVNEAAEQPAA